MGKLFKSMLMAGILFIGAGLYATETAYLYNFDDETTGACDGTATDSGSSTPNNATIGDYSNVTWELLGGYNSYIGLNSGSSYNIAQALDTASSINWGTKFVLETKFWKGSEATGALTPVRTPDGTTVLWYVVSDGKIRLNLDDGNGHTASVITTYSVVPNDTWVTLCAVVDLTKTGYRDAIKFYINPQTTVNNVCNTSYAAIASSIASSSYPATAAFDGVWNTLGWESASNTSMTGNVYIGEDFGSGNAKHIREITIKQGVNAVNNTISSFKVQRSTDNSTWTDVATITTPTDGGIYTYDLPASSAARYWRLLANAQSATNYWLVRELEMREIVRNPALSTTYTYTTGISLPSTYTLRMLKKGAAFTLKCDYVKVTADAGFTTYDTANFYTSDFTNYIKPGSSSAVILNPASLLKRVTNPASDFENGIPKSGVPIAYDSHPTNPSVFHGIFEFNFQLDSENFDGTVIVDIYIKKPEDSIYKKIGQITTSKPESGDWNVKYYWDSKVAAYDWTSTDAQPYRTDGLVKFRFQVR